MPLTRHLAFLWQGAVSVSVSLFNSSITFSHSLACSFPPSNSSLALPHTHTNTHTISIWRGFRCFVFITYSFPPFQRVKRIELREAEQRNDSINNTNTESESARESEKETDPLLKKLDAVNTEPHDIHRLCTNKRCSTIFCWITPHNLSTLILGILPITVLRLQTHERFPFYCNDLIVKNPKKSILPQEICSIDFCINCQ